MLVRACSLTIVQEQEHRCSREQWLHFSVHGVKFDMYGSEIGLKNMLWLNADTNRQYDEGYSDPNLVAAPYPGMYHRKGMQSHHHL